MRHYKQSKGRRLCSVSLITYNTHDAIRIATNNVELQCNQNCLDPTEHDQQQSLLMSTVEPKQ